MNLYGDTRSGNCYKIKLLASLLDIRMVWIGIDILAGDTREEDFLGRNPNGVLAPGHGPLRVDEVLGRRRDV